MTPKTFNPELLYQYLHINDGEEIEVDSPIYRELLNINENYSGKIGHSVGGMKVISRMNDLRTSREVAVAEMRSNENRSQIDAEQFLREARLTAALEHPNIVPVYDIGLNEEGNPFFTMKFMKDENLAKVIRELVKVNPAYTRKYTLSKLLDIFIKVCDALSYAHSKHVVHLDIKPSNIMIGDCGEVYICDWGLAKILQVQDDLSSQKFLYDEAVMKDITLTGEVKGTPGYMAPEQIETRFGDKNETTDIYALGALLYTILTLKRPYAKLSITQTLKATTKGKLPHPKDITYREFNDSLDAVCMKALALEQEDRYTSVEELVTDIRSYQEGFVTQAETKTPLKSLFYLLKRNRLLTTMVVLVIITGVAVGSIVTSLLKDKLRSTEKTASARLQLAEQGSEQERTVLINEYTQKIEKLELQNRILERGYQRLNEQHSNMFVHATSIRGNAVQIKPGVALFNNSLPFTVGTISFWFYANQTNSNYPQFFQLGNSRWHIDNLRFRGGLIVEGGKEIVRPKILGTTLWGKWHHMAITVTQDKQMTFFIDGKPVKVRSKFQGSKGFALGSWVNERVNNSLDCRLDEASVWIKVLTLAEIKKLAVLELSGKEKGLKAYYKFDGNLSDSSGNKFHLQKSGPVRYNPPQLFE